MDARNDSDDMHLMDARAYLVILDHVSEYPEPISFRAGDMLVVGERYEGPEGWNDWYFCEVAGCPGGWVPGQVLQWTGRSTAVAREDYTARELEVRAGEVVMGSRTLGGWVWCEPAGGGAAGWVPLANLQEADPDQSLG